MTTAQHIWIRNQEEPDMKLVEGNYKSFAPLPRRSPVIPDGPYVKIPTEKERDEWNEKIIKEYEEKGII